MFHLLIDIHICLFTFPFTNKAHYNLRCRLSYKCSSSHLTVVGYESKAVKYGEDEETFPLQRAETGDARLNRDHQSNSVNQRKEIKDNFSRPSQQRQNNNYNQNNERDIFKGSSSSNFFNNKNNGKERDEDYDDNVNINQDKDYEQKKKVNRVKHRRPIQNRQQNNDFNRNNDNENTQDSNNQRNDDVQTRRPAGRPTGFVNNFAGSSYIPTTSKPSSTPINSEQTVVNNHRGRQGQRQRQQQQQYNDVDNFRTSSTNNSPIPNASPSTTTPLKQTQRYNNGDSRQTNSNSPTPAYTISTSAPFRQTQQYNTPPLRQSTSNNNNGQQYITQNPSRKTENYPYQTPKETTTYNDQYDIPRVRQTKTESYPTTVPQTYNTQYDIPKTKQTENYPSKATPFSKTDNYPSNNPQYTDKKPTTPLRQTQTYPTTIAPKPFSASIDPATNLPTTLAPRTSAAFTQIVQQTQNYNSKQPTSIQQKTTTQYSSPTTFGQTKSTPKSTPYTQYTPTVPKITSTTPVSR